MYAYTMIAFLSLFHLFKTGQLENGTLIDISEAAQGVYFMQMLIDEHIVTRRVVKL